MHRIASNASGRSLAALAIVGLAALLLLGACRGGDDPATPSPTPTATPSTPGATPTPAPGTPSPTPDPNGGSGLPDGPPERQVRDLLLRSAFGLAGIDERPDVDAVALRLEALEDDPGQEIWFAVSTGLGVTARLGERSHAAGVFVRRADGSWTEVAVYTLQSTPVETAPELVRTSEGRELAWIGVFGTIPEVATTFELLRFDRVEFSSSLWWFSRGGDAARLIDLDGDGAPEIILDGADRSILCPACAVVEHREVIHRWSSQRLVLVEIAPLDGNAELAALVADAVAQARADLWRRAAATFDEAAVLDPGHVEVTWMRLLAHRIADARIGHAGASAQPLLTNVLAGEYGAAVDLMRQFEPPEVFDPEGPLMGDTHGLLAPDRMAEVLLDYASRAIDYDDELHEAHVVHAFALMLTNPDLIGEARADLQRAVELQPDDQFYAASLAWLTERDESAPAEPNDAG